MTKDRRAPVTAARRRLVFDDDGDVTQAGVDNLANVLQESLDSYNREKMEKWNFDFQNDRPLDGVYEWTRAEAPLDWIGETEVKSDGDDDDEEMRKVNESTPKVKVDDALAAVRKRKGSDARSRTDSGAKRKICFN